MNTADIARELGYDFRWIEFGILSPRELEAQFELFRRSEDKNKEHYRASAFRHYFQRTDAISDEQLERYLEIYTTSADDILKPNHLHELLKFPGLTDLQLQRLSRHALFQDPGLIRIAQRVRLLKDLEAPHLDPAIVESCLASADPVVQRALVEHANTPLSSLHVIANRGVSKAVRNLARVKADSQEKY